MASPQQPTPPSNPFEQFDNYSTVAQQQPPPAPPQHQPMGSPNQQWAAQGQPGLVHQQQPPAPPQQQQQPGSPTMMASVANPFAAPPPPPVAANNNTANPFAVPPQQPVGVTSYPQQPHQQQLVPLPPNAVVQSPWALQPVGGSAMVVSYLLDFVHILCFDQNEVGGEGKASSVCSHMKHEDM